jgi:putative methyltransferase
MAESVIRCLPGEDKTNGFFVACFVRSDGNAEQPISAGLEESTNRNDPPKRSLGEVEEEEEEGEEEEHETSPKGSHVPRRKTPAQLERARRKKQQQKKRKVGL